jgi:3-hexulose-6-phosphate synthase
MKLQISFDMPDLDKSIDIAKKVIDYADIFEIGTILLYKYGLKAIEEFRKVFPHKTILADTKIIDRGRDIISLLSNTRVNWITVMAGTKKSVIHSVCTAAHDANIKVMVDLFDTDSIGQASMSAQSFGADAVLFNKTYTEAESLMFIDTWEMVKGNTSLPTFINAKIGLEAIDKIIALNPYGIIIGNAITAAENPTQAAKTFFEKCAIR